MQKGNIFLELINPQRDRFTVPGKYLDKDGKRRTSPEVENKLVNGLVQEVPTSWHWPRGQTRIKINPSNEVHKYLMEHVLCADSPNRNSEDGNVGCLYRVYDEATVKSNFVSLQSRKQKALMVLSDVVHVGEDDSVNVILEEAFRAISLDVHYGAIDNLEEEKLLAYAKMLEMVDSDPQKLIASIEKHFPGGEDLLAVAKAADLLFGKSVNVYWKNQDETGEHQVIGRKEEVILQLENKKSDLFLQVMNALKNRE